MNQVDDFPPSIMRYILSVWFIPRPLAVVVCEYVMKKTFRNQVLLELETKQYSFLTCVSARERKLLHQWAENAGYFHMGIYDKTLDDHETAIMVKCEDCQQWRHLHATSHILEIPCCTDEEGNRTCGDFSTYCDKCDNYLGKSSQRSYPRRNKILFWQKTNTDKMNRSMVKQCGLHWRTAKRRLRKAMKQIVFYK